MKHRGRTLDREIAALHEAAAQGSTEAAARLVRLDRALGRRPVLLTRMHKKLRRSRQIAAQRAAEIALTNTDDTLLFSIERERLYNGYTVNGRYFGTGAPLFFFQALNDERFDVQGHLRARDRKAAAAELLRRYPGSRIARFR